MHSPQPFRLSRLLEGLASLEGAAADCLITGISNDSRKIVPGDLFLACAGETTHGGAFIEEAIRAGAVAVAYEKTTDAAHEVRGMKFHRKMPGVPLIEVPLLHQRVGVIADRFFAHPARDLFVVGVTGTNGKTTCCHLLAQVLSSEKEACGVIGTLGNGLFGSLSRGTHTTPDALALHGMLVDMRDAGARYVTMEVSSHAMEQGRVTGVGFDAAVFTNLSHDHLDYHGDMTCYALAKERLFVTPGLRYAVINHDDALGVRLLENLPEGVEAVGYGLIGDEGAVAESALQDGPRGYCRLYGRVVRMDREGLELEVYSPWGEGRLRSALLGRFNASNLLAALAVLVKTGFPLQEALHKLSMARAAPGRMEHYGGAQGQPLVVVDYAHTPDALEQALRTLRALCRGRLWCVFGCGGDRDRDKRPLMGAAAAKYADRVVVTDDNPRHEASGQIIGDILSGIGQADAVRVQRERAQAIAFAIHSSTAQDVVLIAGKGHEDYQWVGDRRLPFSDVQKVRSLLKEVA